jgi:hypothetical protein
MSGRIGGLIPLLLRKTTLFTALKTFTEIGLFYGGLVLLRFGFISVWELLLLSLAVGGTLAPLISRFGFSKKEQVIWKSAKRSFFLPSAGLFLVGWFLWRWWHLPEVLFKAGLIPFFVSVVLFLDYIERQFHSEAVIAFQQEAVIAFFQRAAFIPFPIFLSVLFNLLNLL